MEDLSIERLQTLGIIPANLDFAKADTKVFLCSGKEGTLGLRVSKEWSVTHWGTQHSDLPGYSIVKVELDGLNDFKLISRDGDTELWEPPNFINKSFTFKKNVNELVFAEWGTTNVKAIDITPLNDELSESVMAIPEEETLKFCHNNFSTPEDICDVSVEGAGEDLAEAVVPDMNNSSGNLSNPESLCQKGLNHNNEMTSSQVKVKIESEDSLQTTEFAENTLLSSLQVEDSAVPVCNTVKGNTAEKVNDCINEVCPRNSSGNESPDRSVVHEDCGFSKLVSDDGNLERCTSQPDTLGSESFMETGELETLNVSNDLPMSIDGNCSVVTLDSTSDIGVDSFESPSLNHVGRLGFEGRVHMVEPSIIEVDELSASNDKPSDESCPYKALDDLMGDILPEISYIGEPCVTEVSVELEACPNVVQTTTETSPVQKEYGRLPSDKDFIETEPESILSETGCSKGEELVTDSDQVAGRLSEEDTADDITLFAREKSEETTAGEALPCPEKTSKRCNTAETFGQSLRNLVSMLCVYTRIYVSLLRDILMKPQEKISKF